MKKSCSQLKDAARECLLGHYGILIGAMIIITLAVILCNIPFNNIMRQGIQFMVPARILLGYVGSMVVSLVAMIFSSGLAYMHLNIARKKPIQFGDVLYCLKNRPDKYLGFGLIMLIVSTVSMLPGMLCSIIGAFLALDRANLSTAFMLLYLSIIFYVVGCIVVIIIALMWSQTIFLLLDHPELTVRETMKKSKHLMKGNKGRLFVLYISFIGWFFLGLLTFGLGFLWIEHYLLQSQTQFYLDLIPAPEATQEIL